MEHMKKKLLIVDSSKAIRFLLQTVFSRDFEVITAPDGCTAMYWLSKREFPDLIITDPQLSDLNSWELIEQLDSSTLFGNIPVIVLSSLPLAETAARCKELNVARFFNKPFDPVRVLEAAKSVTRKNAEVLVPA